MPVKCPICGSKEFVDQSPTRKRETCAECRSKFRTRSAWMILTHHCNIDRNSRILHFAPEHQFAKKLKDICGDNYEAYDYDPTRYKIEGVDVRSFDLCKDIQKLSSRYYDIIIHNHIMEHIYCNYTMVILGLHSKLKIGGKHVFSVPIFAGYSSSDLDPELPEGVRKKRFLQRDHIRKFGRLDFDATLGMVLGTTSEYDLSNYVPSQMLLDANIPESRWHPTDKGTVFVVERTEESLEDIVQQ